VTDPAAPRLRPRRPLPLAMLLALGWHASGAPAAEPAADPPAPRFVDATRDSGIEFRGVCGAAPDDKGWLVEAMGSGAAWLDYDGDGLLDLYLVNGSTFDAAPGSAEPSRLFRATGGGRFVDVTAAAGAGHRGWGQGVAVGDIDNDGDPDLFLTAYGPDVLYRNDGGRFTDVTAAAGVAGGDAWGTAAAFFDMENDGDLDLYVGNYMDGDPRRVPRRGSEAARSVHCTYRGIPVFCGPLGRVPQPDVLYRNDGRGKFTDVTRQAGMALAEPRYALGVVTADLDADGDQDVYVANDSVSNSLWRNDGRGRFTEVAVPLLVALNADGRAQAGMGTDAGDYDGDGWLDLVVTNFSYDWNTLYRSRGGEFFVDDSARAGMLATFMELSWGVGFHDFDRDGDLDLFIANGHVYPNVDAHDIGTRFRQRNHLFLNVGGGRLREVGRAAGAGLAVERSFRGAAFADYDDDGDVDVLVTALDEAPLLLRNDGPFAGHALRLRLVGKRSNRDGVGARVEVVAGGRRVVRERTGGGSYLSASDPRLHVGLGAATRAERVEVRWPSGVRQVLTDVPAGGLVVIEEEE